MTAQIIRLDGAEAFDLIYRDYLSTLSKINQETMQRAMSNSSHLWLGLDDDKVLAVWGLIPPTFLSDRAYLWLYTTHHFHSHVFMFVRHSQHMVDEMLEHYPLIVGHGHAGAPRSLRWLRWLGAEFGNPQGDLLPFEIKAKQWHHPPQSVQSA